MKQEKARIDRRDFFAAAGVSTYSLLVFADDSAAAASELTGDEIRTGFQRIAPLQPEAAERRFDGEPNMTLVDLECDVLIAGGGPAGVCATLAAARHGAKSNPCARSLSLGRQFQQ